MSYLGMNKAQSARLRISTFNPLVEVIAVEHRVTTENALELLANHDLIIDATDNYSSRYILSDACILLNIPLVSGSAIGFEGQVSLLCTSTSPW